MKPTPEQVAAFAHCDVPDDLLDDLSQYLRPRVEPPAPPGPHDIALRLAAALLSSNRFGDDAAAAVETAWTLVIPYYQGQLVYERQVRMFTGMSSPAAEAEMSPAEARSYVTGGEAIAPGGETGNYGEVGEAGPATTSVLVASANLDPLVQARWQRITEATGAVVDAQAALEEAKAILAAIPAGKKGRRAAELNVARRQAAFDAAAQVQSAAYL